MSQSIRRSKLITPHGPGALLDLPGNLSVIVSGPHQWELTIYPEGDNENKITDDPRLARFLGVQEFRMPPAVKKNDQNNGNNNVANQLIVPVFRMPRWHYCGKCRKMTEVKHNSSTVHCEAPCNGPLIPIRWVAVCPNGHLTDVPLRLWVHRNRENPNACKRNLTYHSGQGGSGLSAIQISCECGAEASLDGITSPNRFRCFGKKPWTGRSYNNPDYQEECDEYLRIVTKGGSNVYYSSTESGFFLPLNNLHQRQALIDRFWDLEQNRIREKWKNQTLRPWLEGKWEDSQLRESGVGFHDLLNNIVAKLEGRSNDQATVNREGFRFQEFQVFSGPLIESQDLFMREEGTYDWHGHRLPEGLIKKVVLLDKLRETRILTGFQRLMPDSLGDDERRRLMWGREPGNWLPGIIVRGEGIFIQFDDERLEHWEKEVKGHFDRFMRRYERWPDDKRPSFSARYLFLHTLAHLLMRRLTFECGYGSSSLRERIYCDQGNLERRMNAIVIYTAAGDAEGSLGGLVQQGEPGRFESILRQAVDDGEWCSSDPVCSDIGREGQGPEGVNGAACHNCALVPETSCEEFNKYLDRKFVIDVERVIPSLFVEGNAH